MKNAILPLLCLIFSMNSCGLLDDIEKASKFEVPLETTVTLPQVSVLTDTLKLENVEVETAAATIFDIAGTDTSKIEKLSLNSLKVSISKPKNGDFDFLKFAKIYIQSDKYPEIELASITEVPDNASSPLSFQVYTSDFKKYVFSDKFILRVVYLADKETSEPYEVKISPVFSIDLKVLGQ